MAERYPIFDADNHYYEAHDCFTRHMEPKYRDLAIRYLELDGRPTVRIGDTPYTYGAVYKDRCPAPGSLVEFLRSLKKGGDIESGVDVALPAAFRERGARLALMDEQGVEAAIMLPTLGVTVEHFMRDDPVQTFANLTSFNKWVDEDWGFDHESRIFSPAMLSLLDLDLAVAELERVLAAGAKIVHLVAGPQGRRSPADPIFDPFWARIEEAGAVVAFHSAESGYNELFSTAWGENPNPTPFEQSAFQWMNFFGDRPIMETLTSLIFMNLFDRFPSLSVASLEHGSIWVRYVLESIDKKKGMGRNGPWPGGRLNRRPSEIFREHIYVAPFPEDDVLALVEWLGADRVLCGSDFPHAEGLKAPGDFWGLVEDAHTGVQRLVMRDNGRRLLGLDA
ncbi:amidohydrolase [Myxococcota bacterium]|nr:amidohydrolase [Myxococcota bacterium]